MLLIFAAGVLFHTKSATKMFKIKPNRDHHACFQGCKAGCAPLGNKVLCSRSRSSTWTCHKNSHNLKLASESIMITASIAKVLRADDLKRGEKVVHAIEAGATVRQRIHVLQLLDGL